MLHTAKSRTHALVLVTVLAALGCSTSPQASSTPPVPSDSASVAPSASATSSASIAPSASAVPSISTEPSTVASPTASASAEPSPAFASVFAEGVVSGPDEEYRISFAPDGLTAWFARGTGFFPETREATIMETRFVDGAWTDPTTASFSGTYPDIDPWISPDGASIYFSSIRPVGDEERTDVEIFRVDRVGDGWSEPVHLADLGSERDELGASVDEAGAVWFASDRPGGVGGWDLYAAAPNANGYEEPAPVAGLSTAIWEFNPGIDAAGTTVVFTSINREGGTGLGDLFVSTLEGGTWSTARPLALNSVADEYHPSLSPDGATLYFVRRSGDGDLYEVPWAAVDPGR